jgi:hypothetical protein
LFLRVQACPAPAVGRRHRRLAPVEHVEFEIREICGPALIREIRGLDLIREIRGLDLIREIRGLAI